jgi:ABC-type multidrug transport system fused ATPase/permease subunit
MPLTGKKSLLPPHIHHQIYFICLCILAASMSTSYYVTSLIQILMGANWLLEGNYREKTSRFVQNHAALAFAGLYLVSLAGLIWSKDLAHGLGKEQIDRLPMLTLTFLIVSSRPLSNFKIRILVYFFFAAVLVVSFIGFYIWVTGSYVNFRKISPFVSHIYFSMMVVMTIFALPWFTARLTSSPRLLIIAYTVSAWLIVYLFILRSLTGIICFAGVIMFLFAWTVYNAKKNWIRIAASGLIIILTILGIGLFSWMYNKVSMKIVPEPHTLQEKTSAGNSYSHLFDHPERENGHFVYYFLAEEEARDAWNKRSDFDFDGRDLPGNEIRITLYRYLSSMGLRKDAEAITNLTEKDIEAIEKGTPNFLYTQWPGFIVRFHQSIWEVYWYRYKGDPSGHTLTQRIELWKGSYEAFKEKPILGWGTGDIFFAVEYGLKKIESQMDNYHMKPHNQYIVFLLTIGVVGSLVLYFLFGLFIKITGAWKYLAFNIFLVIMGVSMIANHPIDAQAGQTFFTFFSLYFGFLYPRLSQINNSESIG